MPGASHRLLLAVLCLWGALRWWMTHHLDDPTTPPAIAMAIPPRAPQPPEEGTHWPPTPVSTPALHIATLNRGANDRPATAPTGWEMLATGIPRPIQDMQTADREAIAALPPTTSKLRTTLSAEPGSTSAGRWSGSAWLLLRNGAPAAYIATNGQLGGSQAGALLRWRANRSDRLTTALTARLSGPLSDSHGAELALGGEWHPFARQPVWLGIERRIALGAHARNAWSAQIVGGFWKPDLPLGLVGEGYGQAGIVGLRNRDAFVDGQVRIAAPVGSPQGPRIGVGLWGAAQPGVSRLDMGPVVAVPLTLGRQRVAASVEGRLRVAGDAAPRSGIALTLGTDF